MKKRLVLIQFIVALTAFSYVLWLIDWQSIGQIVRITELSLFFVAFTFVIIGFVPVAVRWSCLLHALSVKYSWFSAFRAYLTGAFYGIALPGVIGGDAARIWVCSRESDVPISLISGSVLIERLLGLVSLLLIASIGIFFYPYSEDFWFSNWISWISLTIFLGVLFTPRLLSRIDILKLSVNSLLNGRYGRLFGRFINELSPIRHLNTAHLFIGVVLSIGLPLFDIMATYTISQALGFNITFQAFLIVMPIVYLITVLPISPGGIGVREAAMVFILAQFGLSASDAALLSLSVFLIRVAVGIIGGIQHLMAGARLTREILFTKQQQT